MAGFKAEEGPVRCMREATLGHQDGGGWGELE